MFTKMIETPSEVFDLVKTVVLSACLWNGILNIMKASGFMNHIIILMKPLLSWIYGNKVIEDEIAYLYLSSNFIANLLGLGSLATISGLQAMKTLKNYQENESPCKEMMILVVLNTTGLSLIPTTLMTLRQSYHSSNLLGFFPYTLIVGIICTLLGIFINKVIHHG